MNIDLIISTGDDTCMDDIFTEASEELGLLYDRYYKLPDKIKAFMDSIQANITKASSKGDFESAIDLSDLLKTFKREVKVEVNNPDPINLKKIKNLSSKVKSVKNKALNLLDRLSSMRKQTKYGSNLIQIILTRAKVYHRDHDDALDEDLENKRNKILRDIGRSMDWVEKVLLDLMNFADQDFNLLTIVNKVYFRRIFEQVDWFDEDDDDLLSESVNADYESYFCEDSSDKDDTLSSTIKDNDEEYYPVFAVLTSYDFKKLDNLLTPEQKHHKKIGRLIRTLSNGDRYTHAIISFDTSLEHMYSFDTIGFINDSIMTNIGMDVMKSIYVNVTFVTKEERDLIRKTIKEFEDKRENTKYDYLQLLKLAFGKKGSPNKAKQICSTFVGYLLSIGNRKNLHKDFSLIRPEDLTVLPRAFFVINFKDKDDFIARRDEFEKRVKQIYDANIDEIRDYNNILPKIALTDALRKNGNNINKVILQYAKNSFR